MAKRKGSLPHRQKERPHGQKDRARTKTAADGLPLHERLRLREEFFQQAGIDPRQFLHAFDHIPGLNYFVKDADSRTLLNNREYARRPGRPAEEEIVGKRPSEYVAKDLADHYEADDRKVYQTGEPLRNIIEIGFNEQGVPDWIITDKFPIKDARGCVVGIMGTMQTLERRIEAMPHLGEVGKAAAFIRENLGRRLHLSDIAEHVGVSERHLQRRFRAHVRMSIQQFIIHSRVHAAAQELIHSKRPMAEIAVMLGFTDQSALTNTFRRVIGVTPREFRRRHLKNPAS